MIITTSNDRVRKGILIPAFLLLNVSLLCAQMMHPVKWSLKTTRINDDIAELQFRATIDNGWHVYSQTMPIDGPLRTEFLFDKFSGATLIGKAKEPTAYEEYDEMFRDVSAIKKSS